MGSHSSPVGGDLTDHLIDPSDHTTRPAPPDPLESTDLRELVIARHRRASFVITSNRAVEEWLALFNDPILGNRALNRLTSASYWGRLSPRHRGQLNLKVERWTDTPVRPLLSYIA